MQRPGGSPVRQALSGRPAAPILIHCDESIILPKKNRTSFPTDIKADLAGIALALAARPEGVAAAPRL
ncbi:MAG: hypothetical protein RLT05_00405, partial [Bauldia litoralis]